jgi:hypothetical protein
MEYQVTLPVVTPKALKPGRPAATSLFCRITRLYVGKLVIHLLVTVEPSSQTTFREKLRSGPGMGG